jgi:hypothetical protein
MSVNYLQFFLFHLLVSHTAYVVNNMKRFVGHVINNSGKNDVNAGLNETM